MTPAKIFLCVGLFMLPALAKTQDVVGGLEKFTIDADYAGFMGNDTLTYVEVYYSIQERNITYRRSEGKYVGGMNMYATVSQGNEVVRQQEWTVPHVVTDSSQLLKYNNIVGVTSFALPEGTYEFTLRVEDFYSKERSDTITFPLSVQRFPKERVSLSDIEICTSIRRSEPDSENVFYKNTLEVIPNVLAVFGSAVPALYYYVEIYNLDLLPMGHYEVLVSIYDAGGQEMFRQRRTKRRPGNSSVEVGTVDVNTFPGGTYTMAFSLLDTVAGMAYTSSKKFFMLRLGESTQPMLYADTRLAESEFAVMDEHDFDEDFHPAKYIALESEIKEYGTFSNISTEKTRIDAKRKFLYNFWKKREETGGLNHVLRRDYVKRVENANERFSGSFQKGWQTDRGRVYILYGNPDEVDRHPNAPDNNPYEIWSYHQLQGGVMFVFIDRTGFGNWTLVHSTHREELRDDGWTRFLRK